MNEKPLSKESLERFQKELASALQEAHVGEVKTIQVGKLKKNLVDELQ